ncbi:sulfotransferase domain-containing protein [Marixanthomonas sp. SCSIO 43207]|uniref:sulfotransferase domain-containing protein n=1 Tax=Marixanthomonas sp. SCSIO 43207 TaxID=2779360 RepID=UPI001CA8E231|nr:sulfotransferase domain-containing protein [Marixanthomonas sp. SCSIO 43207]UAB81219.1 sulfotransferase domain-containing protein [Marixanthomonas sp. SCSIO 43207]
MKTNLFIAGACKSGTSYVHSFLGKQPDICPSNPKEPYFFELPAEERNESMYYKKYFSDHTNEKYLLDGRHRTMFFSWMPQTIYDYNKDSKFIFILRNPVDRAYSHWWMWYARKIIKTSFHKTIRRQVTEIAQHNFFMEMTPHSYIDFVKKESYDGRMAYADAETIVESGYYFTQISRFLEIFEKNQLLILDYDEIKTPHVLATKMKEFLGISIQVSAKEQIINKAPSYAKPKLYVSTFFPKTIKTKVKNLFFSKKSIPKKSRILLQQQYHDENKNLYEKLGITFATKWM